ncbi:MAG: xanthine dehydrogenase molybdopterin binding subunit [Gammaproteobacteria bacterium]|nr:xanthine dehydrogenase molybdopterin binding subunit [Gammaproteobacteria bacterium]
MNEFIPDLKPASLLAAPGAPLAHDSARKHVTGEARYICDHARADGQLFACIGGSAIAHGRVRRMDLSRVRAAPGVMDVVTAAEVPGKLDIGAVFPGDPLFAADEVEYVGQPLFAVAARDFVSARRAAALAHVEYDEKEPVLEVERAMEEEFYVRPPHRIRRGDADAALAESPRRISGEVRVGGQEHFYLEGQASLALPEEDGGVTIHSSSQNPTETQKLAAQVLALPMNMVTVVTRRMGGGFGGKETHAGAWACIAALLARRTGRAVECRLARRDDMVMTGKRHPFVNRYDAGFGDDGAITAVKHVLAGQCGNSPDLSDAVVDRAMFHGDNSYYLPHATIDGLRCKTHTVSNTAFRGFGGPQGMIAMEALIDEIAFTLGADPLDIRKKNLYGGAGRNITPYHQEVAGIDLAGIVGQLETECEYRRRRAEIAAFNRASRVLKRGLALTPVKFGISFTVRHMNQAGALVQLYTDGSILVNHGGTEMGQGLMIKVAQVVARELGADPARVGVTATRTDKIPNTSPTAASSGADINGMAARNAARTIKRRLRAHLGAKHGVAEEEIVFAGDRIRAGGETLSFAQAADSAHRARVQLFAGGFYKTPKIYYDRERVSGRPYYYFAGGAAASEVLIDTLTGEYKLLRADIVHDVGNSINPAMDIGQIEGGYIQGVGWLTCEELKWDARGRLLTDGPATYKIPAIADAPPVFNVRLLENAPNSEETIFRSKAVGEPPLMLAISAWCAIRDAVASLAPQTGNGRVFPKLNAPATPEEILRTADEVRRAAKEKA